MHPVCDGPGAAVAQHTASGGKGVFLSLTLGEKGAPREVAVAEYGALQRNASLKAAEIVGATFELLTYPDAEIILMGVEEPQALIHAPNESVDPREIADMALAEALFLQRYSGGR